MLARMLDFLFACGPDPASKPGHRKLSTYDADGLAIDLLLKHVGHRPSPFFDEARLEAVAAKMTDAPKFFEGIHPQVYRRLVKKWLPAWWRSYHEAVSMRADWARLDRIRDELGLKP